MAHMTKILTAAGTLGCAAAIGFVMQSSENAKRLYGTAPADSGAVKTIDSSDAILDVEEITLTSGELGLAVDVPAIDAEVVTVSAPQTLPAPEAPQAAPTLSCEMIASARPMAAAMVNLTLDAACLPNERVTIHHNGMIFTDVTSATGTLDIDVPALSREAVFIMAFSNAEGAVAQTVVEDLEDFDRVVLQWKGDIGFEIHAREFGAAYGSDGHIWHDAPGDIAGAITGESGFTTRHGNLDTPEPLMAEVYSFPTSAAGRSGAVALTVETEVTNINCGLEIEAQTLQIEENGTLKTRNLTLPVPECDAAGTFLVLNNLLQDLKVAAR